MGRRSGCALLALALVASNAALAGAAVAAVAATPLAKVTELLTQLRDRVSVTGREEATTYDKFACFCKSATTEKTTAISKGEDERNTLQAEVDAASLARKQQDDLITSKLGAVATTREEVATLRAQRREAALKYEREEVDLTGAVQALEAAIDALRAAKIGAAGLLQRPAAEALRRAAALAQALAGSDRSRRAAGSLLAQLEEAPEEAASAAPIYEFKAGTVISTLEDLKVEFKTTKNKLDSDEVSARQSFEVLLQQKEAAITADETALENHKTDKATETQRVMLASKDLTTASAQLLDDQIYLRDLSAKCSEKAQLWDERSQMRANELNALTKALEAIEALSLTSADAVLLARGPPRVAAKPVAVVSSAAAAPPALVQLTLARRSSSRHLVRRHRGPASALPAATTAVALKEASAAPVPLASGRRLGRRARCAALLGQRGRLLGSAPLLALAARAEKDPFAKVKQLIQELVEKLLKQAEDEANHKGWCDREVALAEQTRDTSAEDIAALNGQLEVSEARRAKLTLLVSDLDKDLLELNTTLQSSTAIREEERSENEAAIIEATKSRDAVAAAIDTLSKFYKGLANNAMFLQTSRAVTVGASASTGAARNATASSVEDDMPDPGFTGSYGGEQGVKEGVLAMLEVVRSDFARTAEELEKAEKVAEQEYYELQKTAGVSQAAKSEAKKARAQALSEADTEDQAKRESLDSLQAKLDGALNELESLRPACLDGGMSAEERKARRSEEMEALKQALCILDQHGLGGIDSC